MTYFFLHIGMFRTRGSRCYSTRMRRSTLKHAASNALAFRWVYLSFVNAWQSRLTKRGKTADSQNLPPNFSRIHRTGAQILIYSTTGKDCYSQCYHQGNRAAITQVCALLWFSYVCHVCEPSLLTSNVLKWNLVDLLYRKDTIIILFTFFIIFIIPLVMRCWAEKYYMQVCIENVCSRGVKLKHNYVKWESLYTVC